MASKMISLKKIASLLVYPLAIYGLLTLAIPAISQTSLPSPSFGNITTTGYLFPSVTNGIAAATGGQGGATPLTTQVNVIGTCATNAGVIVPTTAVGSEVTIINRGANPCNVYPPVGATWENFTINTPGVLAVNDALHVLLTSSTAGRLY
jgi:hypothetical protein